MIISLKYVFRILFLFLLVFPFVFHTQQLNIDHNFEIVYTSPRPNSILHNPSTSILLRSKQKFQISNDFVFEINGNRSGLHTYTIDFSDDLNTVIIDPHIDFNLGEEVLFKCSINNKELLNYSFFITSKETNFNEEPVKEESNLLHEKSVYNYTIHINNNPWAGNIFYKLSDQNQKPVNIMDNSGNLIFTESWLNQGFEWKINKNNMLSYFDGPDSWNVMDSLYNEIDTFYCANGYIADKHDFLILPNGHAFLIAYDQQPYAMDTVVIGGDPNALVEGFIIQEFDSNHNLIFQWRSWDHFHVTDNVHLDLTSNLIAFVHGNAIDLDDDGHILISCRSLDEITKIDRQTGDLIWRWGGSQNEFNMLNDYPFTHQHCIRSLGNSRYILYDNGNYSNLFSGMNNKISRGVEYVLDTTVMTCEQTWEFYHPDSLYAHATGSIQRLPNGNTFINWGNLDNSGYGPRFTEIDTLDQIVFELEYDFGYDVYRAHKFNWFFDSSIVGCADSMALNYAQNVLIMDSSCIYPSWNCDNGICIDPLDGTGNYSLYNDCLANCSSSAIDETQYAFRVYPNPFNIETFLESSSVIKFYELFDCNGQLIQTLRVNKQKFRLSREGLDPGIYFLKLYSNSRNIFKKLIIY